MTIRLLFIAAMIAWGASVWGIVWQMGVGGIPPGDLLSFLQRASFVPMVCAVMSVVLAGLGVWFAWTGSRIKALIGIGDAFVWGALGALYVEISQHSGLICIDPPIPAATYAPGHVEALLLLLIGLTGACVPLALLTLRTRQLAP